MTGTGFRKVALGSCMALAALAGMGTYAGLTASPVFATSLPGMSNLSGQDIMKNLNAGNIDQYAQQLSSIPGSGGNFEQFQSILGGLNANGATPSAGGNIIDQVKTGQMTPMMGQGLASTPNLGNLSGQNGVQTLLNNPAIQNIIKNSGGGVTGMNALIQIIQNGMGGSGTGNDVLSQLGQDGLRNVAKAVQDNNPQLAGMLGQLGSTGSPGGTGSGGSGSTTPTVNDIAKGLGDLFAAAGNNDALAAVTQILSSLLGGGGGSGGGSGSGSGGGGVNTEGENYKLENKECSPYGQSGCPQNASACACPKQQVEIVQHHNEIRNHVNTEFEKHRKWIIETYWLEHILPALMLMAEQLSVAGIQQVEMIGTLLDAKHQLETQRLMQQLTAQAHKDYQPSEGMCTFGTTTRSLAASNRKADLTQAGIAARMMQRQTLSGDVLSLQGESSDTRSRVKKFIDTYCDKADNANGLQYLCKDSSSVAERRNIDVDFTRNVESRLTLEVDLTPPKIPVGLSPTVSKAMVDGENPTKDEEDLFALAANLYANDIADPIKAEKLASADHRVRLGGSQLYLDLRSIFAKRSVAQNSFAAITAMRSEGDTGSAPYTKALIKELGVTDTDEIEKLLGKKPSYFAQMEVLTKKIYQNPTFYTELYDKPVNIERKGAAIQAIGLMQDRDLYNSLLRSEAVLSVLLETMLMKEQEKVINAGAKLKAGGSQ